MRSLVRTLACTVLALVAGMASYVSAADERVARAAQWAEAAARQAQEAQRRQREARLRWEYEHRRSAAHARMPNTLYVSTPSVQAHTDLACPVLVDDDTRRLYRDSLKGQPSSRILRAPGLFRSGSSSNRSSSNGVRVFAAQGTGAANPPPSSSKPTPNDRTANHKIQASGWAAALGQPKSGTDTTHHVYLVPSASEPLRQGFVRVINHSAESGEVSIAPVDAAGRAFDTITLSIDANKTVHFNSNDLETGNEGKGLTGSTGSGEGDWRLAFTSDLDIEVLSYIRTTDGFLTAMHDVAPADGDVRRVAIFNPGANKNQVSRLRLINPTDGTAEVTIRGTDDKGIPGSGEVSLSLGAGTAREISAEQLEEGGTGLTGALGDGSGKWRLEVESEQAIVAMSLLESPTDHLTNLSTVPEEPSNGVYGVPLFPPAGDASGRQGFVRVINDSATDGEVRIKAYDETERDYEALTLTIGANEVVHFNSDDLEQGSPQKGLSGGTGAGEGDWRLELTSELEIEVLSYIRTTDGFLTAMHDVAPSAETRHRVAVFNPGSNRNQESLLRLINPGDVTAEATITGIDDNGTAGVSEVSLSLSGGSSRTVGAWDLESGAEGLDGALGDGAGKWQLMIESDRPVVAMSLLRSPTGHLTNLSTAPGRGARGGTVQEPQTAEAVFRQVISGPIVQSKCIACHVEGGASGNTRLVFAPESDPDHEATNLQVFRDFLDEEGDGASYILNKIQGALGHGGGIQVAAGTDEYANMERFLSLLGEDVGSGAIAPEALFDGVKMEPASSTLRRAAIIFAGRMPTQEEYESVRTSGLPSLRTAIRELMGGPAFHEFLVRASNDRLFTDREELVVSEFDRFVDYTNKRYQLAEAAQASGDETELHNWERAVQYGAMRAPLELIARVAEQDLPYTEILTADYIMANPWAAEAYGAPTEFNDSESVHEFQPSEILSYYRESEEFEVEEDPRIGQRVVNPGPLSTVYPHAGILNTKVFLQRYPTTPTNRNRARSRWTYYHFLGLDIEKSASRTADPVALADTNNPTMNNPACTVCHTVMDPVAGAYQNYGDEGLYRDKFGGMDSLDDFYKTGTGTLHDDFELAARSWSERQTVSRGAVLSGGEEPVRLRVVYEIGAENEHWSEVGLDHLTLRDSDGDILEWYELEHSDSDCGAPGRSGETGREDYFHLRGMCPLVIAVDVPADDAYQIDVAGWVVDQAAEIAGTPATLEVAVGDYYREGDTWYRDMRNPGFNQEPVPDADSSLQWLSNQIVADERFSESTVKFWWPAILGSEVAEPPEDTSDADFEGALLSSNAQAAEVQRLAQGFRRGFSGGSPYNLKDLLVEMTLSRWFRSHAAADLDPVRAAALRGAGAKRLLTPEELAHKTLAITGFQWGRPQSEDRLWRPVHQQQQSALTDGVNGYGLLYGGIDSDGVKDRARDLTSVMAGVVQSHALESSCPIVMKELYLLPDAERKLFSGFDASMAPTFEFGDSFAIEPDSPRDTATLGLRGRMYAGEKTVSISFVNDRGDRTVRLDKLLIVDGTGTVIESHELENLDALSDCNHPVNDHFALHCNGTLYVPISIPADGDYEIEVIAWANQAGDELPMVEIELHSDTETSLGAMATKDKLVELYEKLLGVEVALDSREIRNAYGLFIDVWERRRQGEHGDFYGWNEGVECDWPNDQHYLDGILEDAFVYRDDWEWGEGYDWDWDHINAFFEEVDFSDRHGVAETWSVILAYLMMDYRYLYL
ncbi:MAG: DUF1588 domain-containing protein [Gammaproteobacteria bacterium]|nr:DUF1588 domain-containing protein [Gammaproteobacteria bacterium]